MREMKRAAVGLQWVHNDPGRDYHLEDAVEETTTAGSSGLSYDAASDTYTYLWKTSKAWAGTCRQFNVRLDDGTEHKANFKVVR